MIADRLCEREQRTVEDTTGATLVTEHSIECAMVVPCHGIGTVVARPASENDHIRKASWAQQQPRETMLERFLEMFLRGNSNACLTMCAVHMVLGTMRC